VTHAVFVVRHRTVDLIAMSALRALRVELGMGDRLASLARDDAFALSGEAGSVTREACLAQAHWFNPNKHHHGWFGAEADLPAALAGTGDWPAGWIGGLRATDRPDLLDRDDATWEDWVAADPGRAVTLATWDREQPVVAAPWSEAVRVARVQLWTLGLDPGAGDPFDLARRCAVTTGRREGLLVNPHMEGWSFVDGPKETA